MDLGTVLQFSDVERGLKELNTDISLDVPVRRSGDWTYLFKPCDEAAEANRRQRAAVYLGERYLCALDRGSIPEIKVYGVKDGFQAIEMNDIDRYDDSKVSYMEVLPSSPHYNAALTKAERHDDNFTLLPDGRVFFYQPMRFAKVKGAVQKLGWRHTFEALLRKNIPGVNRSSLSSKFNVDMLCVPMGPKEEVHDALFAE
jgi:hypothetical protein